MGCSFLRTHPQLGQNTLMLIACGSDRSGGNSHVRRALLYMHTVKAQGTEHPSLSASVVADLRSQSSLLLSGRPCNVSVLPDGPKTNCVPAT